MHARSSVSEPTTVIVEAVARVRDTDPVDLSVPLYEAIDSEAINTLFEPPTTDITVSFEYLGHDVTIQDDLTVVVDGTVIEPNR